MGSARTQTQQVETCPAFGGFRLAASFDHITLKTDALKPTSFKLLDQERRIIAIASSNARSPNVFRINLGVEHCKRELSVETIDGAPYNVAYPVTFQPSKIMVEMVAAAGSNAVRATQVYSTPHALLTRAGV